MNPRLPWPLTGRRPSRWQAGPCSSAHIRTAHGPVVNASPVISWKYSQWGYEFKVIKAYLGLARATSMDEFGAAIELVPLSQHYTYADKDGNIAYWMSGRDPVRPSGEWRLPQGAVGMPLEWDSANLISRSTDRNTSQGYYCGWNNKTNAGYANPPNNISYSFGPFHRAHVIDDYLSTNNNLTFEQVQGPWHSTSQQRTPSAAGEIPGSLCLIISILL